MHFLTGRVRKIQTGIKSGRPGHIVGSPRDEKQGINCFWPNTTVVCVGIKCMAQYVGIFRLLIASTIFTFFMGTTH